MKHNDFEKLLTKLPAVPGIMNKKRFFNSAVLLSLIEVNEEYHFLFEKRSANIRQGGEICFPGGEHDPDKDSNFKETAVRETCEELGINEEKIEVLGELDTFVGPMGVTVAPFVGKIKIDSINELVIDHQEVEKVFILPVDYFIKNEPNTYEVKINVQPAYSDEKGNVLKTLPVEELGIPKRYSKSWKTYNHRLLFWKSTEGTIWGITAEIISSILELL